MPQSTNGQYDILPTGVFVYLTIITIPGPLVCFPFFSVSAKPACSSRGPYDPGGRPLDQANEQKTSAFMPGHGEGHGVSSFGRFSCVIVLVYLYAEYVQDVGWVY